MNIEALKQLYASGISTPANVVEAIFERIEADGVQPVWISLCTKEQVMARAHALGTLERGKLPLWGIPFAVKDNIDVLGLPTTAGCPAFAYTPTESANVVTRLEAAGAILIGKTNMDQFATGLVGTRSPYGICHSVFSAEHIAGGSSSGSAIAVASGLVTFSLGTDTAGSGRVPAMFNNIIGLKPTRGTVSAHGVVPACRSLDCVSIFAETAADADAVLAVASGFDPKDPYARKSAPGAGAAPWVAADRFRFGVPLESTLEYFGDDQNPKLFQEAVQALEQLGGEAIPFDPTPFLETARLLYQGPWVAERLAATGDFYREHADAMDPIVAAIVGGGQKYSAEDTFKAAYRLEALRRSAQTALAHFDVMLLPTSPRTYTIAQIAEQPIERNSHLGFYTNFVNLLDLAAIALPAGLRPDGLPFGVSLIGPAFTDRALLQLADRLHRSLNLTLGDSERKLTESAPLPTSLPPHGCLLMTVVGAHLSGQPLNWQLTDRGGRLVRATRTAAGYRMYALRNTTPPKPGLVRVPDLAGDRIEVEVWALPADTVGSFVEGVPQPLTIGKLLLEDGLQTMGFLVEPAAVSDSFEITHFGGWRAYLASL